MTVAELIEELKKFPPYLNVLIDDAEDEIRDFQVQEGTDWNERSCILITWDPIIHDDIRRLENL